MRSITEIFFKPAYPLFNGIAQVSDIFGQHWLNNISISNVVPTWLTCSSQCWPLFICPASCKWTPKPTLNKKSQNCLVIMYLDKKQTTSHLKLQPVFLQKHVCALCTNIIQVVFLCNVVSDIFWQHWLDNILMLRCASMLAQHCIGYFPHKHYLSAMGQHCKSNFPKQYWPR